MLYYNKNYVSLYLNKEDSIFDFEYKKASKVFYNIAIKKPIKQINNITLNKEFYDLETAYGYGGYFINNYDEDFVNDSINQYTNFCLENKIIAEFIRFYPFHNFINVFERYLDFFGYDRDVVVVDLQQNKDERWKFYSSTTRNKILKGKKECYFSISNSLEDIQKFKDLYYSTMKKNNADEFYYFNNDYFNNLFKLDFIKLFCVKDKQGDITSSAIFLEDEKIVSYHLGAKNYNNNKTKYYDMYYLFHSIFDYYHSKDKLYCLLGGGRTNAKDDSLLYFKSKFSNLRLPFYIGGKIFNKEIYQKYCNICDSKNNKFLRYR
ncbi:MAG: hypothetical protein KatS3mg068_0350 [Candidatus Sericytochromatia bacterium]|nr:MAG: hypothetical protein KatS3mg068_0350 [Candidatus Sericytochromatia bacterium]